MQILYKHIASKTCGHAMFKLNTYAYPHFWQQVTKWYWREGNMKRFNPEVASKPCYYEKTD